MKSSAAARAFAVASASAAFPFFWAAAIVPAQDGVSSGVPTSAPPEVSVAAERFAASLRDGLGSSAAGDFCRLGEEAAAEIVRVLQNSKDPTEREHAIRLWMRLGPHALGTVAAVIGALDGEIVAAQAPPQVAHQAMVALGELGPFVADAGQRERLLAAVLQRWRRTPGDATLIREAARTWSRMQVPVVRDVAILLPFLRGDNPYQVEFASQLLAELGAEAREVMPVVAELAKPNRAFLTRALDRPGEPGIPASGDRTRAVRTSLLELCRSVAPDHAAAVPLLLERCQQAQTEERVRLVQHLGRIGPGATEAVPMLRKLADSPTPPVAREAVTALGMIGAAHPETLQVLQKLQRGPDKQLAARAAAALRQLDRQ